MIVEVCREQLRPDGDRLRVTSEENIPRELALGDQLAVILREDAETGRTLLGHGTIVAMEADDDGGRNVLLLAEWEGARPNRVEGEGAALRIHEVSGPASDPAKT